MPNLAMIRKKAGIRKIACRRESTIHEMPPVIARKERIPQKELFLGDSCCFTFY
jgi:hypothetical protein